MNDDKMKFKKYGSIENHYRVPYILKVKNCGEFKEDVKWCVEEKVHGCFDKDTLICLANGEQIAISDVNVGTSILSYDFTTKSHIESKVTGVFNRNSNKEWVELFFDDGSTIKCTKDHKIYTRNRGFICADELTNDDEFEIL